MHPSESMACEFSVSAMALSALKIKGFSPLTVDQFASQGFMRWLHESFRMGMRLLASLTAMLGAAALTLACMIALVQGTILAISIDRIPLRVFAVGADLIIGTAMLLACIYLATHLAVHIVGVGQGEFPPLPNHESSSAGRSGDSAKI